MIPRTSLRFQVCVSLLALSAISTCAAEGQTRTALHLNGSIDQRLAIEMTLDRAGTQLEGVYFYERVGRAIRVHGSLDKVGALHLEETSIDGHTTGSFEGKLVGDRLTGTWRGAGSDRALPVVLTLEADAGPKRSLPGSALLEEKTQSIRRPQPADRPLIHLRYPVVRSGASESAQGKLNQAMRPEAVYDTPVAKLAQDGWLDEIDYRVNYNKRSLLDVTLFASGVGAYPDTVAHHAVFDLKTGAPVRATDLFASNSLQALADLVNKNLQAEIREAKKAQSEVSTELDGKRFTVKDLDHFHVGDTGLTFYYEYGFPHVIKAAEPPGLFFYPYSALKPYLRKNGLLTELVSAPTGSR